MALTAHAPTPVALFSPLISLSFLSSYSQNQVDPGTALSTHENQGSIISKLY